MRWVKIRIPCSPAATEPVAASLLEVGCGGTEHDAEAVAGYLPVDDTLESRLQRLRDRLDDLPADLQPQKPEMALTFVEEKDWAEAWKAHFHPLPIGKRLVVSPSWSRYEPQPGQVVVELDPGMAFGTGAHPTTQLCLVALEEIIQGGETVLDWGTGSGLLAIAALKLGAAEVIAGDVDPNAVRIARENARRNGVEERAEWVVGERPTCLYLSADVTVCNILANIILMLSNDLAAVTRPGGRLIASGIIDTRREEVEKGLQKAGFRIDRVDTQGEWVAILATRQKSS
jgi:ribosomal protein L11 methyltransferase